jgi:hypothetical protein
MGLHDALQVKEFDDYGFVTNGIFVKPGCRILKGEAIVSYFSCILSLPFPSFIHSLSLSLT